LVDTWLVIIIIIIIIIFFYNWKIRVSGSEEGRGCCFRPTAEMVKAVASTHLSKAALRRLS
jgi:hypothetical protein